MTFSISIGEPRVGWLTASLRFDSQTYEFQFSDVANDPLTELAELGLSLLSDKYPMCSTTFWLEPEGYELRASRADILVLTLSHSDSAFAKLFPSLTLIGSMPVDGPGTAREILRALRAIAPLLTPDTSENRPTEQRASWVHPYPLTLVEQLKNALLLCSDD